MFELVVNFGQDELAVSSAEEELERHPPVEVRGTPLPLTPPFVTRFSAAGGGIRYIEFTVHPRGIGYGGPGPDARFHTRDLSNDEISSIGESLYELLRRFAATTSPWSGGTPRSSSMFASSKWTTSKTAASSTLKAWCWRTTLSPNGTSARPSSLLTQSTSGCRTRGRETHGARQTGSA